MNESRIEKNSDITEKIEKEEQQEKIKRITKKVAIIVIPLLVFLFVSYFILRFVGNAGIRVREYSIYNDALPNDFDGLKIVQFSDIHYCDSTSFSTIKKIVSLINKTKPDIVLFTGDLIDKDYIIDNNTLENIMLEFKSINAKIGKYAIRGEEDSTYFDQVFNNSNFNILNNTVEPIYINQSSINLLTVDETYTKDNIKGFSDEIFTISIIHKPDLSDRIISDFNTQIIFAGHSHNGQVILPLIGPLMKKEGAKKYPSSHYTINNTDLYVSGGIGNSKYQFRLLNHPSINFYRLRTSK